VWSRYSLWKLVFLVVMLVVFASIGIGCLFNPDWGIKHFGGSVRKGGELQTEWNRVGVSFVGFAAGGAAFKREVPMLPWNPRRKLLTA
jgi:hypothetical protein